MMLYLLKLLACSVAAGVMIGLAILPGVRAGYSPLWGAPVAFGIIAGVVLVVLAARS